MTRTEILKAFAEHHAAAKLVTDLENKLVLQFIDLAYALAAKECTASGLDEDESQSKAALQLLKAIRHFDPSRNKQPSTYLTVAIQTGLREMRAAQEPAALPLGVIASVAEKQEYEPSLNERVESTINQNKAALSPRTIRLLRALYVRKPPLSFEETAKKYQLSVKQLKHIVETSLLALRNADEN